MKTNEFSVEDFMQVHFLMDKFVMLEAKNTGSEEAFSSSWDLLHHESQMSTRPFNIDGPFIEGITIASSPETSLCK